MDLLVQQKVPIDVQGPLTWSHRCQSASISSSLGHSKRTPLMQASRRGNLEVVESLVENGVRLDIQGSTSSYPAFFLFLKSREDDFGDNAILDAATGEHWDVVQYLAKHGAALDIQGTYYS